MTLNQIWENISYEYKTDKKNHNYFDNFYEEILAPYKDRTTNLLEIGVSWGHSLMIWKEYFPHATITGIDVNVEDAKKRMNNDRVVTIEGDAYTQETVQKVKQLQTMFDIIIDDGNHVGESQKFLVENYVQFLKDDGVLVIEDIIEQPIVDVLKKVVENLNFQYRIIDMTGKSSVYNEFLNVMLIYKTPGPTPVTE